MVDSRRACGSWSLRPTNGCRRLNVHNHRILQVGRCEEYDVSSAPTVVRGVTEARSFHNKYAASQASGGRCRCWRKPRETSPSTRATAPIVIADYGSSQGKNSLAPMRSAIAPLPGRISARPPICVVHADVAENDFGTLFDAVDTAPDNYPNLRS